MTSALRGFDVIVFYRETEITSLVDRIEAEVKVEEPAHAQLSILCRDVSVAELLLCAALGYSRSQRE